MRILHLSDLHIGKKINDFSLLEDQKFVLDQALDLVTIKNIDLVIIAGDIFDVPLPSSDALKLYEYFIYSLIFEKKVRVIAISGNHDSNPRIEYESNLKENIGYFVRGEYKKDLREISLSDEFGDIIFYPIPYINPYQIRSLYEDKTIKSFDDAYGKILSELKIDKSKRNVCIGHLFAVDEDPEDIESIKNQMDERDEYQQSKMVAGLEQVRAIYFKDFTYTALGHIHRSYRVRGNVSYCGSLIKTDFDEEKFDKYFLIVDIKKDDIEYERIRVNLLRDMKVIRGKMDDILNSYGKDQSFIKVILEDEEPIAFSMDKLRNIFPNILQLTYSNLFKEEYKSNIDLDEMSFHEVIGEFFKEKTGKKLSGRQKEVINDILERIGGEDENS